LRNWIADLRDPWTDVFYYKQFRHTSFVKKLDLKYEQSVLKNADTIIVVSNSIKKMFEKNSTEPIHKKVSIIPNGYDAENFSGKAAKKISKTFTIAYNGTISKLYDLSIFIQIVEAVLLKNNEEIEIHFTGSCDEKTRQNLVSKLGKRVHFFKHVTHLESIEKLLESDLLLLAIPNIENNKGILTGKLFEYLASKKPILCIGPKNGEAAQIIENTNAGICIESKNDLEKGVGFFLQQIELYKNMKYTYVESKNIEQYSRENQAKEISLLFK
jgi:glycosyltransferase involved in cell wall biosynthesis